MRDLNGVRHATVGDPEINSRIAAYELAFRMQSAAPELIDLSNEDKKTLDAYGLDRPEPEIKAGRGGGKGQFRAFATNCLLARRLVERGVRFVTLFHASWDHHSNLDAELPHNCRMADQPVAALHQGPEAARAARQDAGAVAERVRPHAAGREPRRQRRT